MDDIAQNPQAIQREWFVSQYKDDHLKDRDVPNSDFDRYTDTITDSHVSVQKIQNDILFLVKEANEMRIFVNKYLAHHDKKQENYKVPTFEDAYKIIKHIDDLYCKYYLLLNQGGMTSREPVIQYDWWEVFNIPWITGK